MKEKLAPFASIVGPDHVSTDRELLSEFSNDLVNWSSEILVDAVVRPADAAEVSAILKYAASAGLKISPRGAGLSYTKGYVPDSGGAIALDLTRMNEITELNERDLYIVAGAGATWQQVNDATKAKRLRPAMAGPISGSASTLGGAVSQNTLGSMAGVIGLEVVLPQGRIIWTGTGGKLRARSPYYRHFGPDLTGLFTGDTGIYGVKTAVSLQLEEIPDGIAMASFSFAKATELAEAMAEIARRNLSPRLFGTDPIRSRSASNVSISEAGGMVRSIAGSRSTLMQGFKDAAKVIHSGRRALDSAEWSLHLHCEGFDQREAELRMEEVRKICLRRGQEVSANVAIALHAKPYSVRGFVGLNGERWVPVHGIFPLSQAVEATRAVKSLLLARKSVLDQHGIIACCCMFTSGSIFAIEPMFYWVDELGPLHRRYLPANKYARFQKSAVANPEARAIAMGLRDELRDMFFAIGAVHSQVGKYYDFIGAIDPELGTTLAEVKALFDPTAVLNGNNYWPGKIKAPAQSNGPAHTRHKRGEDSG